MTGPNGDKRALLNIVIAILTAVSGWILKGHIELDKEVAVLQTNYRDVKDRLESIEKKLDEALLRRR